MYIEIPEEVLHPLKIPKGEEERRLRAEPAVHLYEKGLLGFGKARELASMTKWGFQELPAREHVLRSYDGEEFEKDARRVAEKTGVKVLGTIGVLILAKRQGIVKSMQKKLS